MAAEPPVTSPGASRHSGRQSAVDRIVVHCTDPTAADFPAAARPDTALGTVRYFSGMFGEPGGSAHYVTDTDNTLHPLAETVVAYHAPPNDRSIGVEIGGRAHWTREQWLDPQVWPAVARGAAVVADVARRWGVPLVRIGPDELTAGKRGICGHVDVSRAWRQSDHTDPGPGFPWDHFMAAVTGGPTEEDIDMTADELRVIVSQEVAKVLRTEGVSGVAGQVAAALRSEGLSGLADRVARIERKLDA